MMWKTEQTQALNFLLVFFFFFCCSSNMLPRWVTSSVNHCLRADTQKGLFRLLTFSWLVFNWMSLPRHVSRLLKTSHSYSHNLVSVEGISVSAGSTPAQKVWKPQVIIYLFIYLFCKPFLIKTIALAWRFDTQGFHKRGRWTFTNI